MKKIIFLMLFSFLFFNACHESNYDINQKRGSKILLSHLSDEENLEQILIRMQNNAGLLSNLTKENANFFIGIEDQNFLDNTYNKELLSITPKKEKAFNFLNLYNALGSFLELFRFLESKPEGLTFVLWCRQGDRTKKNKAKNSISFLKGGDNKAEELKQLDAYLQRKARELTLDYIETYITRGFFNVPYESKYFPEIDPKVREWGYDLLETSLEPLREKGIIRHNGEYASSCTNCFNLMKALWANEPKDQSLAYLLTEIYKETRKENFDLEKISSLVKEIQSRISGLIHVVYMNNDPNLYIASTPSLSHLFGKEIAIDPKTGEIIREKAIKNNKKQGKAIVNDKREEDDQEAKPLLTKEDFSKLIIYLNNLNDKLIPIINNDSRFMSR